MKHRVDGGILLVTLQSSSARFSFIKDKVWTREVDFQELQPSGVDYPDAATCMDDLRRALEKTPTLESETLVLDFDIDAAFQQQVRVRLEPGVDIPKALLEDLHTHLFTVDDEPAAAAEEATFLRSSNFGGKRRKKK